MRMEIDAVPLASAVVTSVLSVESVGLIGPGRMVTKSLSADRPPTDPLKRSVPD